MRFLIMVVNWETAELMASIDAAPLRAWMNSGMLFSELIVLPGALRFARRASTSRPELGYFFFFVPRAFLGTGSKISK